MMMDIDQAAQALGDAEIEDYLRGFNQLKRGNLDWKAMVRRDGVSVFEADIVIQSAKGISGRRDRRRLRYRSRLRRFTGDRRFRYFYELPRFHVVDVAVYRNVIGN